MDDQANDELSNDRQQPVNDVLGLLSRVPGKEQAIHGAIKPFVAELDMFQGMWQTLRVRMAIGQRDGAWAVLGLRGMFINDEPTQDTSLFEMDSLRIIQRDIPAGDAVVFITQLLLGTLQVAGLEVTVAGFSYWRRYTQGRGKSWLWPEAEFPHLALQAAGSQARDLIDEDSLHTRLARYGYNGLKELTSEKVGMPIGFEYSSHILIVAPVYLAVSGAFTDNGLTVCVSFHPSVDRARLRVSGEQLDAQGKALGRLQCDDAVQDWQESPSAAGLHVLTGRLDILAETEAVRLLLFCDPLDDPVDTTLVQTVMAERRNALLQAFTALPLDTKEGESVETRLGMHLRNEGAKDSARFEAAVLNLFALQGFLTVWTGHTLQVPGVDLVIQEPGESGVVLVSVTTGNDIAAKTRRLLPVWNQLRDDLAPLSVRAVIVTASAARDVIVSERQDAGTRSITVLTNEDIEQLYEGTKLQPPALARQATLAAINGTSGPRTAEAGL